MSRWMKAAFLAASFIAASLSPALSASNFFGPPDLTFQGSTFGLITTSQSAPRVIQFALRYDF